MPSVVLRLHSQPQQISSADPLNRISPFSFQEWLGNNIGIIPDQAEQQYQNYLSEFYANKNKGLTIASNPLRDDYIGLLKKLQTVFKDDEDFNRLASIDFNSETELKISIPYFARKLKEIALYYIQKRESLKKSKLKNNLIGSNNAVEHILYEYVLQAFTKKENSLNSPTKQILNTIPELSSISSNFSIEVEELYDKTNYFDKKYSEQHNTTGVYSLSTENPLIFVLENYIHNFYHAFDLTQVPLSALSNPLSQFYVCETGSELNEQILARLGSNYIGNDVYYLTGGYFDYDIKNIKLDIAQGNNFFYWFSGEYIREIPDGTYQDIALSSINWNNATGSSAFDVSDIIFKSVGNIVVEGAWLLNANSIEVNDTMQATMKDGKYFKFPYPSIGLSAEGGLWSGPQINDTLPYDKRFFPSEKAFLDTQDNIADLYWSAYNTISTVQPIFLQDAMLYESGAFASNSITKADKIIVRRNTGPDGIHDSTPNGVFNGLLETSWLFNFDQTEISIKNGNNNIYYPLTAYSDPNELFFRYEDGNDIALSSLNVGSSFAGAIAGNDVDSADMIIKLNSICGPQLEGAWLRGTPLSTYSLDQINKCNCDGNFINYFTDWKYKDGVTQSSLAFKAEFGTFVRFIWTGPKSSLNDIRGFTGFDHDDACEYKQLTNKISLLDTNFLNSSKKDLYEAWKKCTCHAVKHSPLGHKGSEIDSYGTIPDFIAADTTFPNAFSFNNWKGSDGLNYIKSQDVAWFSAKNIIEPDIGWGRGRWTTNTKQDFYLEPGKTYFYYRSDMNRCGFELPYFVINEGYCKCEMNQCADINCIPEWRKAILNDDGSWSDGGMISDMVLNSGRFYSYKHLDSFDFSEDILTYDNKIITTLSGTYVTLSAVDSKIGSLAAPISIPSVNFNIKIPLVNSIPYWGEASFENNQYTRNKSKMFGVSDVRFVYDYLQVKQPLPSRTLLSNNNTIEYKMSDCNSCFIWDVPLTFDVKDKIRRWNKIAFDNCVKSDILNYFHETACNPCSLETNNCLSESQTLNICGCENLCYPSKIGVSATNIPSDMILNTELSGIPVFVDYFARNPFSLQFQMVETTNGVPPNGGLWVPPVSAIYSKAEIPWVNIINDFDPIVASEPSMNLYNEKEIGLFLPKRLATGKYELRDGSFVINPDGRNAQSYDLVRNPTYADGAIDVASTNSRWMKHGGTDKFSGNVNVNGHQTYYPYTANFEITKQNNLGLNGLENNFAPWDENGIWKNPATFPANFRGQFAVNCGENAWYANQNPAISGNVINWQTDVYGNQYFLVNDGATRLSPSLDYSSFVVKDVSNKISTASLFLSNLFAKFKNINFGLSGTSILGTALTTEDGLFLTTEDGSFLVIG